MKNENCIDTILPATSRHAFGILPWIAAVFRELGSWTDRARQRHQLAQLDDAALKDIGLVRADVEMETNKPFWRP